MKEVNNIQYWSMWATWATAVATFLVAFIAIWYKNLIENRKRSILQFEYSPTNDGDNKYLSPESTHDDSEEVWIRARVKNNSNTTAVNVEARLYQIKRENGSWDNRPNWWFKISNLNKWLTSVPPKFTQYIDIAYIKNIITNSDELGFYLALTTQQIDDIAEWKKVKQYIESSENTRLYIGGNYTMILVLLCSNADAKYYKFEMKVLSRGKNDPTTDKLIGSMALKQRLNVKFLGEVDPEKDFLTYKA